MTEDTVDLLLHAVDIDQDQDHLHAVPDVITAMIITRAIEDVMRTDIEVAEEEEQEVEAKVQITDQTNPRQ